MRRMSTGFTITEMIVTVAILGILITIAAPSYNSAISGTRMSGEINNLLGSLNLARSEAIKRGQQVSVSPQAGATCGNAPTSNWSSGWYVLVDSTGAQLQISPAVTHGDTLTNYLNNAPSNTFPCFTQTGYTFFTGTLSLHDVNNIPGLTRCIVFNAGAYTTKTGAICP